MFRIGANEAYGLGWIAACNIPPNATILDEEMSFQLPKAMAGNSQICMGAKCVPLQFVTFVSQDEMADNVCQMCS